ncbi:MAG: hypothetical protein KA285_03435 [Bacteroidia bacterium]|nr:hypothetical protein [Bacteroidia bacterium]
MAEGKYDKIVELLKKKVSLKQEVYSKTKDVFEEVRTMLIEISKDLTAQVKSFGGNLAVSFKDTSEFEVEFTLADETLLFVMHTNIFTFDSTHEVWKSTYVQQNKDNAYCGKIFIYNFLSDSFKYNRPNDIGYLVGRIFINKEKHFFVEGKKQLSYLYNDFSTSIMDQECLMKIIESAILYSLDFDPFTPPFDQQGQISVGEVINANLQSRIATGKRLGFKFQSDSNF